MKFVNLKDRCYLLRIILLNYLIYTVMYLKVHISFQTGVSAVTWLLTELQAMWKICFRVEAVVFNRHWETNTHDYAFPIQYWIQWEIRFYMMENSNTDAFLGRQSLCNLGCIYGLFSSKCRWSWKVYFDILFFPPVSSFFCRTPE